MDSGNLLFNDSDGYADIAFDTNSENAANEVYFRNIQLGNDSTAELSLELKVGELWEAQFCILWTLENLSVEPIRLIQLKPLIVSSL